MVNRNELIAALETALQYVPEEYCDEIYPARKTLERVKARSCYQTLAEAIKAIGASIGKHIRENKI